MTIFNLKRTHIGIIRFMFAVAAIAMGLSYFGINIPYLGNKFIMIESILLIIGGILLLMREV